VDFRPPTPLFPLAGRVGAFFPLACHRSDGVAFENLQERCLPHRSAIFWRFYGCSGRLFLQAGTDVGRCMTPLLCCVSENGVILCPFPLCKLICGVYTFGSVCVPETRSGSGHTHKYNGDCLLTRVPRKQGSVGCSFQYPGGGVLIGCPACVVVPGRCEQSCLPAMAADS